MRLQKGPERQELSPHPNSLHYKEKKTLKKKQQIRKTAEKKIWFQQEISRPAE